MSYTFNPFTGNLDVTPFSLDGAGKIPSDYLPSYVDDVVEYDDLAGFPGTGETGKIYVAKDTGYTYRWTGSVYVRIGSGGEVGLNLGSEGSPSLFFNGDENTGLFSPGADQVAISTNGTERLRITSDGKLGLGTSAPDDNFSVTSTAGRTTLSINADSGQDTRLSFKRNNTYRFNFITDSTDTFLIQNSSFNDIISLNQSGTVGIGGTLPASPNITLNADGKVTSEIAGIVSTNRFSTSNRIAYFRTSTTAGNQFGQIAIKGFHGAGINFLRGSTGAETSSAGIFSDVSDNLSFTTGGATERLRIDSSGNVGIGTSSPGEKLHVNGGNQNVILSGSYAANQSNKIEINNGQSGATRNAVGLELSSSGSGGYSSAVYASSGSDTRYSFIKSTPTTTTLLTANQSRLFINTSGNVGIGTTSPGHKLTIAENSANANAELAIDYTGTNPGRTGMIRFQRGGTNFGYIAGATAMLTSGNADDLGIAPTSGKNLLFGIGTSERARIDSSGRLLVGTSSIRQFGSSSYVPQILLEGTAGGNSTVGIVRNSANASGCSLSLGKSRATSVGGVAAVSDNDELVLIDFQGADGTGLIPAARIQAFVDGTPGANDMPGRLVFSVTADGASSPAEAMRIKNSRILNFANTPVYADNAAAKTGGLVDGDVYRKSDGTLMIVYT
jgi:hypothetical protein